MAHPLSAAARRLTETLGELKAKVREAIAGETGRAVGEAVRLAVAHALTDRPPETLPRYRPTYHPCDDPDADRWADSAGWADADGMPPPPLPDPTTDPADRTRLAVSGEFHPPRQTNRRRPGSGSV